MPTRFDLGPGDDRFTVTFSGVIVLQDLKDCAAAQAAAGAWTRAALFDTTPSSGVSLHWPDVQQLVDYVRGIARDLPPRGRVAVLAPADAVYGCVRMYQAALEGEVPMDIAVVRTTREAEDWLRAGPS